MKYASSCVNYREADSCQRCIWCIENRVTNPDQKWPPPHCLSHRLNTQCIFMIYSLELWHQTSSTPSSFTPSVCRVHSRLGLSLIPIASCPSWNLAAFLLLSTPPSLFWRPCRWTHQTRCPSQSLLPLICPMGVYFSKSFLLIKCLNPLSSLVLIQCISDILLPFLRLSRCLLTASIKWFCRTAIEV